MKLCLRAHLLFQLRFQKFSTSSLKIMNFSILSWKINDYHEFMIVIMEGLKAFLIISISFGKIMFILDTNDNFKCVTPVLWLLFGKTCKHSFICTLWNFFVYLVTTFLLIWMDLHIFKKIRPSCFVHLFCVKLIYLKQTVCSASSISFQYTK